MLEANLAAQSLKAIDERRVSLSSEIAGVNLSEVLPLPQIDINPIYYDKASAEPEVREDPNYKDFQKILKTAEDEGPDSAYVQLSELIDRTPKSALQEWSQFVKADLLFQVQLNKEDPRYSLVLEEYELAIRRSPLHFEIPRALYQSALLKLRMSLYQETEQSVRRGLNEYGEKHSLAPRYLLLSGEQAFRAKDYKKAFQEFSFVVRRYPRSRAAADAAFRRAFLLFEQKNYDQALKTYEDLEKYHSEVFRILQMKEDARKDARYLDRAFYAESLFKVGRYAAASDMFQNLANLFPRNEHAGLLWVRYGDTFLKRGEVNSASTIYEFAKDRYADSILTQILASSRLADTLFLTGSVRPGDKQEQLYQKAVRLSETEGVSVDLLGFSVAKLLLSHMEDQSYQKALELAKKYRKKTVGSENAKWIQDTFVQLLELLILDHYRASDFLAALTTYLSYEEDTSLSFQNIEVLLRLSDAAKSLGLWGKASEILNRVIYLESDALARQEGLLSLVDILIHQGEVRKASERLRRFSFAYPKSRFRFLYNRSWGDIYVQLENARRAIQHYEKALAEARKNPEYEMMIREVYIRLGELYAELKLPLKSIDAYQNFLSLYQDKTSIVLQGIPFTPRDEYFLKLARYRIADLYFDMRDYSQALNAYRDVAQEVEDEPFLSHALYRIGECYLALDDRPSAVEAFKKLKSDDGDNLWVRAAQSYIKSVEMEVKHGIRIFN